MARRNWNCASAAGAVALQNPTIKDLQPRQGRQVPVKRAARTADGAGLKMPPLPGLTLRLAAHLPLAIG